MIDMHRCMPPDRIQHAMQWCINHEAKHPVQILMASRRLEADRFLTEHYTKDIYTAEGLQWVKKTKGVHKQPPMFRVFAGAAC